MTNTKKIELLKKIIDKSTDVVNNNSSDPTFKVWKNNLERTLIRIFGKDSHEINEFRRLLFFYDPMIYTWDDDFTQDHFRCFKRDFETSIKQINAYIEELDDEEAEVEFNNEFKMSEIKNSDLHKIEKVFISHSSKDSAIVEEIIEVLETIGLRSEQIFCSSIEGYGIGLGENHLERLKTELNSKVLVIFILSENFYSSPISLCEMGATWIKTNEHIPILIPPFDYKNIEGVIPLTQGFKINETLKMNLFKMKVEEYFFLKPIDHLSWERRRDKIISRIEKNLNIK